MWWLTGVRRPAEYKELYEEHLDEVEEALSAAPQGGPYFLGKQLSLVDIRFAPFIERQIASLAYFKGYDARDGGRRPKLKKWLEVIESRQSYQATKSDWYTHSRALPPQLSAGCAPEKGREELQNLIDELPTKPANTNIDDGKEVWIEPGWNWCSGDMAAARREAAERLIHNHENIVRFASRAAGTPGLPASSAPLADPRATPNKYAEPVVDLFLRHIVDSLLSSSQGASGGGGLLASMLQEAFTSGSNASVDAAIDSLVSGPSGIETAEAMVDCLDYLRARIGVPRDMSHPAAQALRAELKTMSGQLQQSTGVLADANSSVDAITA
jgi:glutathione S-transferase